MTTLAEGALERNDRYVREFVEALRICPYAKQCRETGKLHRRVLFGPDEALPAIRAIEALPADSLEVPLLIFPSPPAGRGGRHAGAPLPTLQRGGPDRVEPLRVSLGNRGLPVPALLRGELRVPDPRLDVVAVGVEHEGGVAVVVPRAGLAVVLCSRL